MAPLLRTHFRPRQRSLLSTLFTATFLCAAVIVAFPCPARPGDRSKAEARLDGGVDDSGGSRGRGRGRREEVVVMMNERGKRRFMEER